ncbi:MAG: M28 family peptidase [Gemmataceae bacterium]
MPVRVSRFLLSLAVLLAAAQIHAADDVSIERLRKDLTYLTSDECEGRGAQTQGLHKAAAYIAAEFKRLGLEPGGLNGTYFQPFSMRAGRSKLVGTNKLVLKGPLGQEIELKLGEQFQVVGMSGNGKVTAPVVFAGYGISDKETNYDDYQGADVAGKIVIVLRKSPMPGAPQVSFGGQRNNQLSSLVNKVATADQAKAAGIIFVSDRDTVGGFLGDRLMPFENTSEAEVPANIPSVHVRRSVVDEMLQSSLAKELRTVEREIDRDLKPRTTPLTGWTATVDVAVERKTVEVKNVIGVLPGHGPLAKEIVVVGAHYDHLGRGERGSLERDEKKRTEIHHGADDNGSGTVSVMELARRFAGRKGFEGRTLVFMTFSGEEQGLLGSRYFCKHPTFPLDTVAAMVNLDMVGRLRPDKDTKKDALDIGGVGSAKGFETLVDELNKKYDFKLKKTASGYGRGDSDHASFAEKKLPTYFFFTGLHTEYHRPSDTVDTINFSGMRKIVDMVENVMDRLATMPEKPLYVQTHPQSRDPGGAGNLPRMGLLFDYNNEENKGALLVGVTPGGPAEKGGLKSGDYIVEIAGKPVKNVTSYMVVMTNQKKGAAVEVTVDRKGEKKKLSVTPE